MKRIRITLIRAITVAVQYTKILYHPDVNAILAYVLSRLMYLPDLCNCICDRAVHMYLYWTASSLPRLPELTVGAMIESTVVCLCQIKDDPRVLYANYFIYY